MTDSSTEALERDLKSACRFIQEICVVDMPGLLHAVTVPDLRMVRSERLVFVADRIRYDIENACVRLPGVPQVASVEVRMEPLPRDGTGALLRAEISHRLFADKRRDVVDDTGAPQLLSLLRAIAKHDGPFDRETSLELDLGMESLKRLALFQAVEAHFGLTLEMGEAANILTIGDLVAAVGDRSWDPGARARNWDEWLRLPLTVQEENLAQRYLRRAAVLENVCCIATRALRAVCRIVFFLEVEGSINLPRDGPFIICVNHTSYLDIFFLTMAAPGWVVRRLFFYGAAKHSLSPRVQWLWTKLRGIRIDESGNFLAPLRLGIEGLRRNLVLCIFPEGRRSIDGRLLPFRDGASILAIEQGVPVVPVAIVGTHKILARGSRKFRRGPVKVVFGKPIVPEQNIPYVAFSRRLYRGVQEILEKQGMNR